MIKSLGIGQPEAPPGACWLFFETKEKMTKGPGTFGFSFIAIFLFIFSGSFVFGTMGCHKTEAQNVPMQANHQNTQPGVMINIDKRRLGNLRVYDQKLLMVDVRGPEELDGKYPMLEGSVHIQDSLIFKNPDILPEGKTIVLICRSGRRSTALGKMLIELGYSFYNLEKGLKGFFQKEITEDPRTPVNEEDWESERGC